MCGGAWFPGGTILSLISIRSFVNTPLNPLCLTAPAVPVIIQYVMSSPSSLGLGSIKKPDIQISLAAPKALPHFFPENSRSMSDCSTAHGFQTAFCIMFSHYWNSQYKPNLYPLLWMPRRALGRSTPGLDWPWFYWWHLSQRMIHPACIINNELQSLREVIHPIGGLKNCLNMIISPW